jgi:hypothetical protein
MHCTGRLVARAPLSTNSFAPQNYLEGERQETTNSLSLSLFRYAADLLAEPPPQLMNNLLLRMVVAAPESPPHFDHRRESQSFFDRTFSFLMQQPLRNVTNFIRNMKADIFQRSTAIFGFPSETFPRRQKSASLLLAHIFVQSELTSPSPPFQ